MAVRFYLIKGSVSNFRFEYIPLVEILHEIAFLLFLFKNMTIQLSKHCRKWVTLVWFSFYNLAFCSLGLVILYIFVLLHVTQHILKSVHLTDY